MPVIFAFPPDTANVPLEFCHVLSVQLLVLVNVPFLTRFVVASGMGTNFAVTVLSAFIVTVTVFVVPVAPLQLSNFQPDAAVAVTVTFVPDA